MITILRGNESEMAAAKRALRNAAGFPGLVMDAYLPIGSDDGDYILQIGQDEDSDLVVSLLRDLGFVEVAQ